MKKYALLTAALCALPLAGCSASRFPELEMSEPEQTSSAAETRSAEEIDSIVDGLLGDMQNRRDSGRNDIAVQTPELLPESHTDETADASADSSEYLWMWSVGVHEKYSLGECQHRFTAEPPDPDSDAPIYMPSYTRELRKVTELYPELADQPVREIARYGFCGADYAHRIVLPETITFFGSDAFSQSSVREFAHHAEEITMEENCFSNCDQLKTVTFFDNPVRLGDSCFDESAITEITGEKCNLITNNLCFMSLPDLECVSLSGDIQLGDYNFLHCGHACTVALSGGGITLGTYAFSDSGIETLEIGECQRCAIGENGFSNCGNLKSVTLGEGVAELGNYAFFSCPALTKVSLPESLSAIGTDAFGDCSADLVIEVPKGSFAEAYCKEHDLNYQTVQ